MQSIQSVSALLIVDPFNDFFSVFGKVWPILRPSLKSTNLLNNISDALATARSNGIQVAYAPHYRFKKETAPKQKFLHPGQYMQSLFRPFSADKFGGKFHRLFTPEPDDIISSEHACSSGFIGTNLDEKLRAAGVERVYIVGVLSNTCIESTARSAVDLGYHVAVLRDCVAAWGNEDHQAAIEHTYPNVVHELITSTEFEELMTKSEAVDA